MRRAEADSAAFVVKDLIVLTLTPSKSTFFIIPCPAKPYAAHGTGRNSFQLRNDGTARGLHEKRWPTAFSMETWSIFSRYGSRKRKKSQGNAIAKCQCRLWIATFPQAEDSFLGVYPQGISDKWVFEICLNGFCSAIPPPESWIAYSSIHGYICQVTQLWITKVSRFQAQALFFLELCWLCFIKGSVDLK